VVKNDDKTYYKDKMKSLILAKKNENRIKSEKLKELKLNEEKNKINNLENKPICKDSNINLSLQRERENNKVSADRIKTIQETKEIEKVLRIKKQAELEKKNNETLAISILKHKFDANIELK